MSLVVLARQKRESAPDSSVAVGIAEIEVATDELVAVFADSDVDVDTEWDSVSLSQDWAKLMLARFPYREVAGFADGGAAMVAWGTGLHLGVIEPGFGIAVDKSMRSVVAVAAAVVVQTTHVDANDTVGPGDDAAAVAVFAVAGASVNGSGSPGWEAPVMRTMVKLCCSAASPPT